MVDRPRVPSVAAGASRCIPNSAWVGTLIGSLVPFLLAVLVWKMPFGDGARAYLYGFATGVWAVDWTRIWGVILFNTLVVTGVFEKFRRNVEEKEIVEVNSETRREFNEKV